MTQDCGVDVAASTHVGQVQSVKLVVSQCSVK